MRSRTGPAITSISGSVRVCAYVVTVLVACLVVPAAIPTPANAFGTINGVGSGQRAEHERITRAALACPAGTKSHGECFESRSLDQLAGHDGTFGAIGAPDLSEALNSAAHCDDADYLDVPAYPQTRAQATAALHDCVDHLRTRFDQGIDAAEGLLDSNGQLIGSQVDLRRDCSFSRVFSGGAKCDAIEGFGRALHGVQDFYSHSNWADQRDPSRSIDTTNPPGLNLPAPSNILDLTANVNFSVPQELSTGYFSLGADFCLGINARVKHACLNKDKALINPITGSISDPKTPRGQVLANEQKAVTGAIIETRRQWSDFRQRLIERYGAARGQRMILAITQDVRKVDIVFTIDTTSSMEPYIAAAVAAATDITNVVTGSGPVADARITDYRIGVVDYKDLDLGPGEDPVCPGARAYDAVVDLPFTTDRKAVVDSLNSLLTKLSPGGCGDAGIPEDVLSGVNKAVGFPWRDGATKAIILMGDAPGWDPEPHSALTSAAVVAAANAVDPASIYPILVGSDPAATSFMTNLAAGTGGQAFASAGGVGQALLNALSAILDSGPPADNLPPKVNVSFPDPPAGQGGFFNAVQVPVQGSVTASDPSGVSDLQCIDTGGGLTQGDLEQVDATTARRPLRITGDGEHIVICTATDSLGNQGVGADSNASSALMIDTTPPTVSCSVTPEALWPPNHKFWPVESSVTVQDQLSGPAGFVLTSVTSNEPGVDSDILGWDAGSPDTSGELRAERLGGGQGRVYTLRYTGSDVAGNTGACSVEVSVPHDR